MSPRLDTRTTYVFAVVAVAALVFVAAGCANGPAVATPPPESAPSNAAAGHSVVGRAPSAKGGLVSIIVLEPRVPGDFPVPAEPKVMDQFGMGFNPDFLLARAGQRVEFRNSEDVLHNIRVTESATRLPVFNVSPPPFTSYVHAFERPGFYAVSCDIHPSMHADILVTSTPYAVVADEGGNFAFSDVSRGSYNLTVYYGGRRIERVVEVAGSRTELILDDR